MSFRRRLRFPWAAFVFLALCGAGGYWAITNPDTPLPPEWNPIEPLDLTHPYTPLTKWKMNIFLNDDALCLQALETATRFSPMPDLERSDVWLIRNRVNLSGVQDVRLYPVETRCQTALRLALWIQHGVQPAAEYHLGERVKQVHHFSSYNCRAIRTGSGGSNRMSTHATADGIDISGFTLDSGRRIMLKEAWSDPEDASNFLKETRDTACEWFRVTLGPDYNSLHADHFHLQHTGWGLCR